MRVVINGAGIAGPTLAWWLWKAGHEVLLVEKAPRLRTGGYVIDFWGAGYDVADRMGLIPRLMELGYVGREVRFVDGRGRKRGGFSVASFSRLTRGRYVTVRRSDLAAIICGALEGKVETIFGDSVAGIEDEGGRVRVRFDHAAPREADLVVGADGLHSRVRQLAFGPEAAFEVSLGYHVAAFDVVGYRPRDELVFLSHAAPGRQISRWALRDDRTLFLFVFRDEYLPAERPADEEGRKAVLARVFADAGWESPRILAAMRDAGDVYFDGVSQIRLDRWAKGRTVLVGDAAACISLVGGEGTGLAMVEAYVLAGELHRCGGDLAAALTRYQERLMPLLKRKQQMASKFASSFAPRTALGIRFRDALTRLLRFPVVLDYLFGSVIGSEMKLPDYGL